MPKALERLGLGIPLRRPDSSPTYCAALVEALAKHMLFMHQQIPCTYDELRRSVGVEEMVREAREADPRRAVRDAIATARADVKGALEGADAPETGIDEVPVSATIRQHREPLTP